MQEGICKNCGSIVFVNPKKDKCHCLFCNCVFPASEALEIAKDPSKYEFPNEEQPDYIPDDLDVHSNSNRANINKLTQVQKKKPKKKTKAKYTVKEKSLPDINLTKKQIFSVIGISLVLAALFLLVMLPQTIYRDKKREEITTEFQEQIENGDLKESINFEDGFVISRLRNTHLDLITDEMLSKEEVKDIFQLFCESRASVIESKENNQNKIYQEVSLRVAVPEEGGYLIKDKSLEDLEDLSAIVELP